MGFRRRARELVLQALYYIDIRGGDAQAKLQLFRKLHSPPAKSKAFFVALVAGVLINRQELDVIIEEFSSNWKISRMSCVDRNILRMAVYEMMVMEDIPIKVSINEAIDIGKKYGTHDSGGFINGILDGIHLAFDKGLISFEPVTDTDLEKALEIADGIENGKNLVLNGRQKKDTALNKETRRLIRLGPGVRKRITVRPDEPVKPEEPINPSESVIQNSEYSIKGDINFDH